MGEHDPTLPEGVEHVEHRVDAEICRWTPVDVIGCHWMSLDVIGCRWMSLDVIGCRWMSLDVIGRRWTSWHGWTATEALEWNEGHTQALN